MTLALLFLLYFVQVLQVFTVAKLYRDNCTLRTALLTVQRPEVAAVVRKAEQPVADEPEEPVRKVLYR